MDGVPGLGIGSGADLVVVVVIGCGASLPLFAPFFCLHSGGGARMPYNDRVREILAMLHHQYMIGDVHPIRGIAGLQGIGHGEAVFSWASASVNHRGGDSGIE